jgi:hypothetical protein
LWRVVSHLRFLKDPAAGELVALCGGIVAALADVFCLFVSSGFILDGRNTNVSTSWILSLDIFIDAVSV